MLRAGHIMAFHSSQLPVMKSCKLWHFGRPCTEVKLRLYDKVDQAISPHEHTDHRRLATENAFLTKASEISWL